MFDITQNRSHLNVKSYCFFRNSSFPVRNIVPIKISKEIFVDLTCFVSPPLASQPELICSKSTIKTVGDVVKSIQKIKQQILIFIQTYFNLAVCSSVKNFAVYGNSCRQMFFKISVLRNFAKFTRKHLCWSLFLIKLHA